MIDYKCINYEEMKMSLRNIRNEIVGSSVNKSIYIQNGFFTQIINEFTKLKEIEDLEYLKLLLAVINSFVITHPNELCTILENKSQLIEITIKIILTHSDVKNQKFIEAALRVIKNLATLETTSLFSIETCFTSGFLNKLDEFLINDICYQYISIILCRLAKSFYYKQTIYRSQNLIDKLIDKFFKSENKQLMKFLLEAISILSEDQVDICKALYDRNVMLPITSYIRYYDNHAKIYAIGLMCNVYSTLNLNVDNESLFSWSTSILFEILKEETIMVKKIRIITTITAIIRKSVNLQNAFYNLGCLDNILKELRLCFTEEKLKEIEETVKNWKTQKNSRKLSETQKEIIPDEFTEYKISLIDCLGVAALEKEDIRRKIIESKEISVILYLLEENNSGLLKSSVNLIFSLSRANLMYKKILQENNITDLLFKLSNHVSMEIQIQSTSSLCNFLLDIKKDKEGIIDCVAKLLKILSGTKHNKIRSTAVFALKNIIYNSNSLRDIKKYIMKKITYDYLLTLCDDDDNTIQIQALYIFRILVNPNSEDVDEVFSNCKAKLLKVLENKIENVNEEIVTHSLFILCIISAGNEKHKACVMEKVFLGKIFGFLESGDTKIKSVSLSIINNLLDLSDSIGVEKRIIHFIDQYDINSKIAKILGQSGGQSDEINEVILMANKILLQLSQTKKQK